ncbi:hypothetical protein VHA01S_032_00280 [Vibrio halioticoli NBRC 102217]|uniref:Uncharacterized protein n=1 Tax=Vibrio halioticoli NBRC 102217 TaxID=1219072 RepID=V5FEH2_9VIBR|nr:ATP-grasp fold amidoligase family protein [Vibrio halioticoli]GAD90078.1 hypothetical protein VHA01S_032_00280 [Vibrio halioticoli NBRC 102217]
MKLVSTFKNNKFIRDRIYPKIELLYHKLYIALMKFKINKFGEIKFITDYYNQTHSRKLNLNNPRGFSEKIAWLKAFERNDLMTVCADKYLVREYVKEMIGEDYLIPIIGVYDNVSEIDFNKLETPYVLKVNHSSGGNCFNIPGEIFSQSQTTKVLNHHMDINAYYYGCEWAYKNITRKIIAEKVLFDDQNRLPNDYKFFCFNGEPKFVQVDISRFSDHRRDFYDLDWNLLPFTLAYRNSENGVSLPSKLDEMTSVAKTLAGNFKFSRIDLYLVKNKVYFGEITFYPEGGSSSFVPEIYEKDIGSKLSLV